MKHKLKYWNRHIWDVYRITPYLLEINTIIL